MPKSKALEIATIDLETDPFKKNRVPVPFASCMFDGERQNLFWGKACVIDLVNCCVKSGIKRIYYAHNGGKFDLHFILPALVHMFGEEGLKLLCIGNRLVQVQVIGMCEFRDSFAIIPKALKSLGGKKLDIEIWKLENDESNLTAEQKQMFHVEQKAKGLGGLTIPREFYKEEICRYLRRDCSGLYEAIEDFFRLYGKNMTLASAASKFMEKEFKIKAPKSDESYDSKFRKFYFAGRVEFFGLGEFKGDYKICDINSAFPAAMVKKHWFSTSYIRADKPPTKGKELCFYHVKCESLGALPFRTENGGVSFPHGFNEFHATGWELFAGIELGLIKKVEFLAIYRPLEIQDFTQYINHFYELKKNAPTEAERNFAKLFLNSYYGRLALNSREFKETKITPYGDFPKPLKKKIDGVNKLIEWEHSYDDEESGLSFWQVPSNHGEKPLRFYNVATAASITGWVRAFLLRSLTACKGVLYCDTDSIIALDTSALKMGENLGEWKLEKTCDKVFIAGKKLYCAVGTDGKFKTASKGVRLSPEQIIEVAKGNEQSFAFDAPNFSLYSKKRFTTRRVNRDDKRKKTKT